MNENENTYVDINTHDNYPDSDIKVEVPTMKVMPLKKICMTIGELPTSYLETMTYYEMLIWFINYLRDNIIPTVNANGEATEELQELFVELQNYINAFKDSIDEDVEDLEEYVNNYFENLDVQEEINNKLDQMLEDGVLEQIIEQFLQSTAVWSFDTVADMKNATNLTNGSTARTLGYHSINDGGDSTYKIRTKTVSDVTNEQNLVAIGDNLVAELIIDESTINPIQFGCYGDGTHDDTDNLQDCFDYAIANSLNVCIINDLKVSPKNMEDNSKVCLTLYRDSTDMSHVYDSNIEIYFKRNSKIFTTSTEECSLIRMNISNLSIVNPYLKGIKGKTVLIEMSKIDRLSTTEVQWTCHNIIRNAKLQDAKRCISMQGNTYYNTFDKIYIINSNIGIIMEMTEIEKAGLAQNSNVNRNEFNNVIMTQISSDNESDVVGGVRIEYGDTNKFVNLSFEGVKNPLYLDDPKEHTVDFPVTPRWYTADNMFVNVTMEAVTGIPTYNRAGGTKIININERYNVSNFIVPAQTYIGGVNTSYSPEINMSLCKSLEDLALPNLKKYSLVYTQIGGFGAREMYDVKYDSTTGFTPLTLTQFEWDLTNSNMESVTYDPKKMRAKSIGGMIQLIGKFKFTPTSTSSNIVLTYPSTVSWLKIDNNYGYAAIEHMKLPIIISVGGTYYNTYATIKATTIEIAPPTGGWNSGSTNIIFLNLSLLRDGVTY